MFRSFAIILLDVAIISTSMYYRIEDGVAPGILVFAATAACISLMLEFFYIYSKKRVALRRTK